MVIRFEIPEDLERQLRERIGDLDEAAKEAFLIQGYRGGFLSVGQVAVVLGGGVIATQAWLSDRGAPLSYSVDDLEDDRRTLSELAPGSGEARAASDSSGG